MFSVVGSKVPKFTHPSHLCVTSNEQLCISFSGSNQIIFCEMNGKVIVSLVIVCFCIIFYFIFLGYYW